MKNVLQLSGRQGNEIKWHGNDCSADIFLGMCPKYGDICWVINWEYVRDHLDCVDKLMSGGTPTHY